MATTSYPGVYTEEDAVLNYSVANSPTAVPAFIIDSGELEAPKVTSRYTSWNEFTSERDVHTGYVYWNAVKAWFMFGGGTCYVVPENLALADIPRYDDITLLVATGRDITSLVTQLCVAGSNLFALLDGPTDKIAADAVPTDVMASYPTTSYAAAWYPWFEYAWSTTQYLPPSVVAAATIANVDRSRGVWKSPANVVVNLFKPRFSVNDELQGAFYSGKALNMFRIFSNTCYAWGARTLEDSDNWRYIAVRRLFNMVEHDIKKALANYAFEPNCQPTWNQCKALINNYLSGLWQQGALAGNTPQDAWFVEIGEGTTMTVEDIQQGKLIAKIGLAPVRPAEFIILQVSQNIAQ